MKFSTPSILSFVLLFCFGFLIASEVFKDTCDLERCFIESFEALACSVEPRSQPLFQEHCHLYLQCFQGMIYMNCTYSLSAWDFSQTMLLAKQYWGPDNCSFMEPGFAERNVTRGCTGELLAHDYWMMLDECNI